VAGPTDAALVQSAIVTQSRPEDEPLRLELRDADQRDAPWELSVHEPVEADETYETYETYEADEADAGVIHSADWDETDDDPSNWAGPV
jgi:hypothetical protein